MVSVNKAKSKASKPSTTKATPAKAVPALKETKEKISGKANLRKTVPKKKVALDKTSRKSSTDSEDKLAGKDEDLGSKKNSSLGPKVSKSKAGKKKQLSSLSTKAKKDLPADSSEDELEDDSYSDSSLDSEAEEKILSKLKIKKDENASTSSKDTDSVPTGSVISQETQDRLKAIKKKPAKKGDEGIIYVGRLPNGFEESELKIFFEQFGKVKKLRVSRNKKTGASRHYAFIEFAYRKVAEIAAETMNNYLISNRLLKCQLVPEDKVHPGMVSKYKPPSISVFEQERRKRSLPKTDKQLKRIAARKLKSQDKLQSKLNALGIEYKFPGDKVEPKPVDVDEPTPEVVKPVPDSKKGKRVPRASQALPESKKAKVETKTKHSKRSA